MAKTVCINKVYLYYCANLPCVQNNNIAELFNMIINYCRQSLYVYSYSSLSFAHFTKY